MKTLRTVMAAVLAFYMLTPVAYATDTNNKGVVSSVSATGVADGSYPVFIDLRKYKRGDIIVTQDGGSGTIQFAIFASWEPGATNTTEAASLNYVDVGLDFYTSATFTAANEQLIDSGWKLYAVAWAKLVFTIAGASSDASYTVVISRIHPGV